MRYESRCVPYLDGIQRALATVVIDLMGLLDRKSLKCGFSGAQLVGLAILVNS